VSKEAQAMSRKIPIEKSPSNSNSPWTFIVGGLCLFALGSYASYWVISDSWQGLASLGCQKTAGVVLRTGLNKSTSTRAGNQYALKVSYSYKVADQDYQNDRISFPETRGSGEEAYYQRKSDASYPVNKECAVYYNPRNPAESCLEPGPNYFFLIMIGFVSLLILLTALVCLLVGAWQWTKRKGPSPA
jgi:hypothetical protein